jgi:hypothetical protein
MTIAANQIPPAPNQRIPELFACRYDAPANGATIPAKRPIQESIPLMLPRDVVSKSSGAEAYRTALKY